MTETPQQYTTRILSNVEGQDVWEIFQTTPDRVRSLAAGLTPEQMNRTSKAGTWSIRQLVAHLADCEIVAAWRIRAILAEDGVPLQPFDQNAWASVFRYEETDVAASLDLFDVLRKANVRLLKVVDPALHANAGQHQERGKESIEHLIRLYAGHDINHLRQIERLAVTR